MTTQHTANERVNELERESERGSATVFLIVMFITIVVAAGLALDGTRVLSARRAAQQEASASARVVGQWFDELALRNGSALVNPDLSDPTTADGIATALTLIDEAGYDTDLVDIDVSRPGFVTVTVREEVPMLILGIAGIGSTTVAGSSTVVLQIGL